MSKLFELLQRNAVTDYASALAVDAYGGWIVRVGNEPIQEGESEEELIAKLSAYLAENTPLENEFIRGDEKIETWETF